MHGPGSAGEVQSEIKLLTIQKKRRIAKRVHIYRGSLIYRCGKQSRGWCLLTKINEKQIFNVTIVS